MFGAAFRRVAQDRPQFPLSVEANLGRVADRFLAQALLFGEDPRSFCRVRLQSNLEPGLLATVE